MQIPNDIVIHLPKRANSRFYVTPESNAVSQSSAWQTEYLRSKCQMSRLCRPQLANRLNIIGSSLPDFLPYNGSLDRSDR